MFEQWDRRLPEKDRMRTETDVKIEDGKKRSDDKLTSLKTGRKVCFYYHPFSAPLARPVKTGIFTAEMCPKELKNSAKTCRKCLRDGQMIMCMIMCICSVTTRGTEVAKVGCQMPPPQHPPFSQPPIPPRSWHGEFDCLLEVNMKVMIVHCRLYTEY